MHWIVMEIMTINFIRIAFAIFFFFVFGSMIGSAQTYTTSAGLRLGDGIGISMRQKLIKRTTIEGLFYKHQKSDLTLAGAMLDHHMPVLTKRLNLYMGGGFGRAFKQPDESTQSSFNAFMLNAGLEFTISRLNMSWDFVPVIPIGAEDESLVPMTAFSLRYVIIKKSKNGLFENKNSKKRHKNKRKHHKRRR